MTPEAEKFDSEGTTAGQAAQMLQKLLSAFDNDKSKLAVALGRDEDEIAHALSANIEAFDDDLVVKMRSLGQQRGVEF